MRSPLVLGLLLCCGLGLARAEPSASRVRFAHGWLHDTPLDVSFDWGQVVEGLGFGQVTDYLGVEPSVFETMFSLPGHDDYLWRKPIRYELRDQTLLALGDGAKPWGAMIFDDNTLPDEGHAKLKLVGASNRLSRLTAEVAGPGGTWKLDAFGAGQATGYVSVPAGPYQVRLHRAADDGGLGPRLKTLPPVPLAERCVYTGFTFGAADVAADNPRHLRFELRLDAAPED